MRIKRAHFQDKLSPPPPPQVVEKEVPIPDPEQRVILATIQNLLQQIAARPLPSPVVPASQDGEILSRLAILERKVDAMVNRPGMAYSFTIERNSEGKIVSVTAQPKPPRPGVYRS